MLLLSVLLLWAVVLGGGVELVLAVMRVEAGALEVEAVAVLDVELVLDIEVVLDVELVLDVEAVLDVELVLDVEAVLDVELVLDVEAVLDVELVLVVVSTVGDVVHSMFSVYSTLVQFEVACCPGGHFNKPVHLPSIQRQYSNTSWTLPPALRP